MDGPHHSPPVVVLHLPELVHNLDVSRSTRRAPANGRSMSVAVGGSLAGTDDVLDRGSIQPHERVPLLFIANSCQSSGRRVLLDEFRKSGNSRVLTIHAVRKRQITLGVFVSVVNDRLLRERTEVGKGSVHFLTGTFEETATPGDEERVAGEDSAWFRGVGSGCEVANGVLGVAGRSETSSEETNGVSIWETFGIGLMEINCERT